MILIRFSIRFYQRWLSPLLSQLAGAGGGCRFAPTCSQYCLEACEAHGVWRGLGLALWRIARCHPWGGCGRDPVPLAFTRRASNPHRSLGNLEKARAFSKTQSLF